MFSRRHPFLFFILVFTAIISGTILITALLTMIGHREAMISFGEKVGVIEIKDVIMDSKKWLKQIKNFREDNTVKAIVLRIDSPGGAVGPSQEIYEEIQKTIKKKKVIASMGTVAASGGYYIASAADGIIANPGTITGSIGVIMGYTNFETLFEKIGLYPVVIKSGQYKDIGSPVRKMTDAEKQLLQQFTDTVHTQFINHVAEGRHMDPAEIRKIADGRIFSGEKAKELGLVDRLGNFEDAVDWAGELGGIKGKISTVYPPEDENPIIRRLLEMSTEELKEMLCRLGISETITGGYQYMPGR